MSRKEEREDFNKVFKEHIEQEMASTKKTGKRKRNCMETYNDLNEEEMKRNYKEGNVDENEGWVAKNLFIV
jgi:transposase